jgi:esterase/lipase superfamily enzyme
MSLGSDDTGILTNDTGANAVISEVLRNSSLRTVTIVTLMAVALSACGGRAINVLGPVAETSPNASKVEMLVTTTRAPSLVPGEMYSGERALTNSFAQMTVSIPPPGVHKVGDVEWPRKLPSNPKTDFATLEADEISKDKAIQWLDVSVKKSPDHSVLVFIHGFNNRYEDALYRFAQITHDSGAHSVPILATWPSRGSLLAYGYDRESTNYSRNALETLFQFLAKDPNVHEVNILAHSMGNWLAMESLRQMAIRNGRLPTKFKNVMLADADVDVDVFRQQMSDLGQPRPNFTLFVSRDDRALAVSKRVWGDVGRLGAIDPTISPFKEEIADNHMTVVDLTKIKTNDGLRHSKFAESPEIVQLIGKRLANGQALSDSRVGLGDNLVAATAGAASAVGTGVALAVAAPVAIVDQNTRENFGKQVEALTSGAKSTSPGSVPANCKVKDAVPGACK